MLRGVSDLAGTPIHAKDGDIGRCRDFLIDERDWTLRYLVADTGRWLPGKQVLISPKSLGVPEWDERRFPVNLTKEEIENAPLIEEDQPVSRQFEIDYFNHFNWHYYWKGTGTWGNGMYLPSGIGEQLARNETGSTGEEEETPGKKEGDCHLRAMMEISGYEILSKTGDVGHLDDLLIDEKEWAVRYFVIKTGTWLLGKTVIVPTSHFRKASWKEKTVSLDMSREDIEKSPELTPEILKSSQ